MTTSKNGILTDSPSLLDDAATYATEFLERLPERRVAPLASAEELRKARSADRFPTVHAIPTRCSRSSRGRPNLDSWLRRAAGSLALS
jgi:hypothetical protein